MSEPKDRFGNPMTIKCPLVDDELIPDDDCFLVSTVAEGMTPKICIEKRFYQKENFSEICLNCPNYRI